ncbi:MAG: GNAT family N-acetyltransferase [Erysipelotrichaceae bacterium]|nr:GNAT family N-acetyltransferase [Erysipelotrichaceae bacterium]
MFFRKKLAYTDNEVTIREHYRYKTLEFNKTVETIYFDILTVSPQRKVGYCDLRMGMNPELEILGQVGYHIDEKYRGHHYALKACRLLFRCAKQLGMETLQITCNPDNHASRKTLEALDGTLEGIVDVPESHSCYKWGDRKKCIFTYRL